MQFYKVLRLNRLVLGLNLYIITFLFQSVLAQPTSSEVKTDAQGYEQLMLRIRSRIPQLRAWDGNYASFYTLALTYLERTHGTLSDTEAALLDDMAILPTDHLASAPNLKDIYLGEIGKLATDTDQDIRQVRYALTFLHMITSWRTGVLAELSTEGRIQLLELRRQAGSELSDVYLGLGRGAQFRESDIYDWYVNYFLQTIAGARDGQELVRIISVSTPRNVLWEEGHQDAVRRALGFVDRLRLSNSATRQIEGILKGLSREEQIQILSPRIQRVAQRDLALSQNLNNLALNPPLLAVSDIDSFYFAYHLARGIQIGNSPDAVIEFYYESLASLGRILTFAKDELSKSSGLSPSVAMDRIDLSIGEDDKINPEFVEQSLTYITQSFGKMMLDHLLAYRNVLAAMKMTPAQMRSFLNLVSTVADFADSDLPRPFAVLIRDQLVGLISKSAYADEVLMALQFDSMEMDPKSDPADVALRDALRRIKQDYLRSHLRPFGRLGTHENAGGKSLVKLHPSYRNLAEVLFAFVPPEKLTEAVAQARAVDREAQYSDLGRFAVLVMDLEKMLGKEFAPELYSIAEPLRRAVYEERVRSGLQLTESDQHPLLNFEARVMSLRRTHPKIGRLPSESRGAQRRSLHEDPEEAAVRSFFRSCL
ncbi:MAG: hypothetical protein COV44_02695 [Deltaproteobacteria bacterium CG11_big_fil_rev_8_21_14_0_20_45_16]|nr:MAG: hypothetical protein COV44_02695 [Deltaproteobacteria bacterium CG11_big_fil_rev_8_21_14_0_20_45_16]PIS11235.1 MAG: hypothetical protein COT73_05055 [Bdellovibrio sp. CG10_big_fil_rev_8_21_14_0_10_47_8]